MKKKLKITAGCLLFALSLAAFFLSPAFEINDVTVTGNKKVPAGRIMSCCGLDGSANYFTFNAGEAVAAVVASNPYVENVEITKIFPDKLEINVHERKLSGYVKYMNETYLYIDDNGKVLEVSGEILESLPVVAGLNFSRFSVGETLDVENPGSFSVLVSLSKLFAKYELDGFGIKTVDVSNPEDIHIFVNHIDVELGGIKDADEKIRTLKEILKNMPDAENIRGTLNIRKISKEYVFKALT